MAVSRYSTNQGSSKSRSYAAQRAANPNEILMYAQGSSNLGAYLPTTTGSDGFVNLGPGYGRNTPLDQAQAEFVRMRPEERALWSQKTVNVKGYKNPTGGQEMSTWNEATRGLAAYQKATGDSSMDIWTYMDLIAAGRAGGSGGGGGGAPAPPSKVVTKQIDITNPTEARNMVESAIGGYLGRNPTDYEYEQFLKTIQKADRKNPTISTQKVVSTGAGGGTQKTNVKQEGGVDKAQVAKEYAKSRDDYAETNVETSAAQALLKFIKGGL